MNTLVLLPIAAAPPLAPPQVETAVASAVADDFAAQLGPDTPVPLPEMALPLVSVRALAMPDLAVGPPDAPVAAHIDAVELDDFVAPPISAAPQNVGLEPSNFAPVDHPPSEFSDGLLLAPQNSDSNNGTGESEPNNLTTNGVGQVVTSDPAPDTPATVPPTRQSPLRMIPAELPPHAAAPAVHNAASRETASWHRTVAKNPTDDLANVPAQTPEQPVPAPDAAQPIHPSPHAALPSWAQGDPGSGLANEHEVPEQSRHDHKTPIHSPPFAADARIETAAGAILTAPITPTANLQIPAETARSAHNAFPSPQPLPQLDMLPKADLKVTTPKPLAAVHHAKPNEAAFLLHLQPLPAAAAINDAAADQAADPPSTADVSGPPAAPQSNPAEPRHEAAPTLLPYPTDRLPTLDGPSAHRSSPDHIPPTAPPAINPTPAHQVAVALAQALPDQPERIELTLTPEDLGTLRFDMVRQGDDLHIILSAERPETLELLRRHAPDLIAEMKNAGLQGGSWSFGQWGERGQDKAQSAFTLRTAQEHLAPGPPDRAPHPHPSNNGLDLRL